MLLLLVYAIGIRNLLVTLLLYHVEAHFDLYFATYKYTQEIRRETVTTALIFVI